MVYSISIFFRIRLGFLFVGKGRCAITANGKSIGEVRAFGELKVQERTNVANAFSILLTYKKLQN